MEISKNWQKHLEVLAVGTLCPKISFLAQKLWAISREQTEKAKLRYPFFLQFIFIIFIGLSLKIRSTCKNKGGLIH